MNVLVTGGSGFVGGHCIDHLVKNTSWEIYSFDSYVHKGDNLRHVDNPRVHYIRQDCAHPISDRLIKRLPEFEYILNIASESHVDRSIDDPVPFVENNVGIALHMLEFARKQKCLRKFIQISTDEVYGAAPEGVHFKEWSHGLPSNPYSASKLTQEAIAISYWRTYGIPLIITNTVNMFGETQDEEKFIPMCIKRIFNEEVMTIHGNHKYIGKRNYIHARNFSDALLFLLRHTAVPAYSEDPGCEFPAKYNVAGSIELDNLSMAFKIAAIIGKELKYDLVDFHSARPGHDRRYSLDGSKLASLGWKPPVDFEQSLRHTVEWTLKNKEWI